MECVPIDCHALQIYKHKLTIMGVVQYAKNLASSIPQNNNSPMVPALIGAAGSVIGGALGFLGQQGANKTNLKIARETNAANRANQEYQNEWNLEMWNKQNEYNSPAAQRQRLEAAGLNPIMTGLDGVSQADQLQSADYVATPGAPMLNSGEFLGNGISNAMKTMAEIKLLDAQAKKTDADRGLTEVETETRRGLMQGEFVIQGLTIDGLGKDNSIKDETVKNLVKEREQMDAAISELNQRVITQRETINIAKAQQAIDKKYKESLIEIENKKLSQRDKEIELATKRLAHDIAIDWARKAQGDEHLKNERKTLENQEYALSLQGSETWSKINNIDANTSSVIALLPYQLSKIQAEINHLGVQDTALKAQIVLSVVKEAVNLATLGLVN